MGRYDRNKSRLKWYTISTYVDVDTGEIISKESVERGEYIDTNKRSKNTEIKDGKGFKNIAIICERNRQGKLF